MAFPHRCPLVPAVILFLYIAVLSRGENLATLQRSQGGGLITLTKGTFRKYIEGSSTRDYSLFVYFTADSSICQPCAAMQSEVDRVSREFHASGGAGKKKSVYFAALKLSTADQDFLAAYQIQRVPLFYYFNTNTRYPRAIGDAGDRNMYDVAHNGMASNAIKAFVNARSGSSMRVIRGNYAVPFRAAVNSLKPLIGGVLAVALAGVLRTGIWRNNFFWFGILVFIYIFSVGGGHFSWIHDTPIYKVNQHGVPEFIAGGARSQYVAEGFFVSVTCVSISALIILVQEMPKFVPSGSTQSLIGISLSACTFFAISALLALYHQVSFTYPTFFHPHLFIWPPALLTHFFNCTENARIFGIQRNLIH